MTQPNILYLLAEQEKRANENALNAAEKIFDALIEPIISELAQHSRSRAARAGWRTKRSRHQSLRDQVNEALRREAG